MEAYPLQWPVGRPRKESPEESRFGTYTLDKVTNMVLREIKLLGGTQPVISTNLRLRNDGLPYSRQAQPADKGVAIYFSIYSISKGAQQMCFACDRWNCIEDNIYAICKTIEALRGIERWGSGSMVEQAFTGFLALPGPRSPWEILGLTPPVTAKEIEAAFRAKAKECHPDAGGSAAAMAELINARQQIIEPRG